MEHLREVSNRGRLRIVVGIGNLHVSGPSFGIEPEPFQRDQLMFTVTNVGRRAIFLTQIGWRALESATTS